MDPNKSNKDIQNSEDTGGELVMRPYARLITMIGEQLIRNEKIALLELIKNSYDADAKKVEVNFIDFVKSEDGLITNQNSVIEIKDNGEGMTLETVKDAWMNPAAPNKFLKKKTGKDRTKSGRVIQGEKGIGRFAVFKIGDTVELFTRNINKQSEEIYVKCDLSIYDSDLLSRKDAKKSTENEKLFIDDIKYTYRINKVGQEQEDKWQINKEKINNGVIIRISNLRSLWSYSKLSDIFTDSLKLISPFNKTDFSCSIYLNGEIVGSSDTKSRLDDLLEDAPLHMKGEVTATGICKYVLNNVQGELTLNALASDSSIKKIFYNTDGTKKRDPECGQFKFEFYVFDLNRKSDLISGKLDKSDRELIKNNRLYLYRDGVRVNPYGDPDDDWIGLDIRRGTEKAGSYLSNDQLTGYIAITSKDNPNLRDKTNREGLIDTGNSYNDLVTLVLGILGFLNTEFRRKQVEIETRSNFQLINESKAENNLKQIRLELGKRGDKENAEALDNAISEYKREKDILIQRAEILEDLAGVGLTIDAASHDLMIILNRAKETLNSLIELTSKDTVDPSVLRETIEKLRGQFGFIEDQMHGIQPLFRSTRRKSKDLRIKDIIEKVQRYYNDPITQSKIKIEIKEKNPPLVVKCPEAVLLQVFINLLDNSVYWLTTNDLQPKKISIVIDGSKEEVTFSDSGPGVRKEDEDYIFEPFFTTKGIQGRGLGLYIARQLLERNNFQISYIKQKNRQLLDGANFSIDFSDSEESE